MERVAKHLRGFLIAGYLTGAVVISLLLSFLLRFEFTLPAEEASNLRFGLYTALGIKLLVFYFMDVHRGWLTIPGFADFRRIALSSLIASMLFSGMIVLTGRASFPRSVLVIDLFLVIAVLCGPRMLFRLYSEVSQMPQGPTKNVLIYGAGSAGMALAREILYNPSLGCRLVGFLDDDWMKHHETVMGYPVVGGGRDLAKILKAKSGSSESIDQVLIAMPSADPALLRKSISYCRQAGLPCKTLPSLGELLSSRGLGIQIRDISPDDLLFRDPVHLDEYQIRQSLRGKCVMVTGAAGSIGSELSRQIASFEPSTLVLFDQAESPLYSIDLELRNKYPRLHIVPLVADVRSFDEVASAIGNYEVEAIFHAAAYKHVPLMENHVIEAMRNNVIGTFNVAEAAVRFKVKSFVLISSDKAVNPTNVMGATKRACELICSSYRSSTRFTSVRFGNVLGSNGSVVPLFKAQIAAGGPITVTDQEITRYFMTVSEAVQLVLQASTMGKGSEIFVLDMGKPVKIVDLAKNLIHLAGLIPGQDIQIKFTGLRPGEKLYEELISEGENILPTSHEKIRIFRGEPLDADEIIRWVDELQLIIYQRNATEAIRHLKSLVHEYQVGEIHLRKAVVAVG